MPFSDCSWQVDYRSASRLSAFDCAAVAGQQDGLMLLGEISQQADTPLGTIIVEADQHIVENQRQPHASGLALFGHRRQSQHEIQQRARSEGLSPRRMLAVGTGHPQQIVDTGLLLGMHLVVGGRQDNAKVCPAGQIRVPLPTLPQQLWLPFLQVVLGGVGQQLSREAMPEALHYLGANRRDQLGA
ncbi:hypothetical protein [Candidatus Poriferisodalis sp.]|uniref:hypothetical protein n=1 Tax=Candidatus Poriferisodalis sp. TaxID=3101277 RepID=UPI003B013842